MLRELIGSRPTRRIRPAPVAASAAVHAALIAAALVATRGTDSHGHGWHRLKSQETPLAVHVSYLTPLPADNSAPADEGANVAARPMRRTRGATHVAERKNSFSARLASFEATLDTVAGQLADIHPAVVDMDEAMRGIEAHEAKWTAIADSEFNHGPMRLAGSSQLVPAVAGGIYTPDLVDQQVMPRPGNPKPRYPESLQAAGIEADVNVFFVVDTTGKVDEPSIKFASHVHELFMDAIRASLRRARFFPAKLAGVVVPQLVQQEFRFELRDRR